MADKRGLWVYGVVENKGDIHVEATGIHGTSPVSAIMRGDYGVMVSEEPMKKYPLMRDYLIAHQRVNEEVMRRQSVLPVRFCTMAETADQIVAQVLDREDKQREFRKTFAEVKGKSEYGVRAWWKDLDKVFGALRDRNEKVKRAKEQVLKLPERERHTALIEVGHVVKAALEEENAQTADTLVDALTPHAERYKRNRILGDAAILNAAFFVGEERQPLFDQTVNELSNRYESELQFKYVGPTPPFNFVEIVIHWDGGNSRQGVQ